MDLLDSQVVRGHRLVGLPPSYVLQALDLPLRDRLLTSIRIFMEDLEDPEDPEDMHHRIIATAVVDQLMSREIWDRFPCARILVWMIWDVGAADFQLMDAIHPVDCHQVLVIIDNQQALITSIRNHMIGRQRCNPPIWAIMVQMVVTSCKSKARPSR